MRHCHAGRPVVREVALDAVAEMTSISPFVVSASSLVIVNVNTPEPFVVPEEAESTGPRNVTMVGVAMTGAAKVRAAAGIVQVIVCVAAGA